MGLRNEKERGGDRALAENSVCLALCSSHQRCVERRDLSFLAPEEGFSALVKLHDALYRGMLASELRLDIPFLPHITVGKTSDPWEAKVLADQLNGQPRAIQGMLETLDVITYEKMTVQTLERIPLL